MADVSNLWDLWDQDDMVAAELHKRNLIAQTLLKETESETPKIFQPKSLQKITIDYVLTSRSYNSLQGAVNLYSFLTVRTVDTDESLVALRKHCMELLIKYYPVLVEKVGYEELKAAFQHHPEDFKLMEEKFKSTADSKARFAYLKGTIVEREKVEIDISSPDLEEGFYPYEALVGGIEWPAGIDVTNRESYLSNRDFESQFKMTKAAYEALPRFKRVRLKKELLLF